MIEVEHGEPLANFYVEKQPWVLQARCLGLDPELFDGEKVGTALRHCNDCPVRRECGEQALIEEGNAPYGRYLVRGGMTAEQRDVVHRRGGLRGRDPKALVAGRDGRRKVPPIPLIGVPWSRHHSTLARKLTTWLAMHSRKGRRLPSIATLCEMFSTNPVPMKHVLQELWAVGVLDKRDGYVYRAGPVDSLVLRSRSATE